MLIVRTQAERVASEVVRRRAGWLEAPLENGIPNRLLEPDPGHEHVFDTPVCGHASAKRRVSSDEEPSRRFGVARKRIARRRRGLRLAEVERRK